MAVVHEMHHRRTPSSAMMAGMDMVGNGAAKRSGKVLVLPPAPDAIELRHLRAFVAVAEELNFGRAASRLFVSQPALSRQIRGLERLVGCDLLRRTTHRVELTWPGTRCSTGPAGCCPTWTMPCTRPGPSAATWNAGWRRYGSRSTT
jgi:hypothetical protein